jgi:spore coat polysaccharide biosynthesis protein SpsF
VLAIVQARLSSKRLPGKVLREVGGAPLLSYVLGRLGRSETLTKVIVATSVGADDDAIAEFCRRSDVTCIRGPLDDVAARFRMVVEATNEPAFLRISADSPMIDPAIVDRAVRLFRDGMWDLVTNVAKRTFPKGQSVEVLGSAAFVRASRDFVDAVDKEHVTPYFYRHTDRFSIENFECERQLGELSMVVDTPEDLQRFVTALDRMKKPYKDYSFDELVGLYSTPQPA